MKGTCLRFYAHENRKVHGIAFHDWLLGEAKAHDIHGGTAFKAIAGFGRFGVLHEARFFELAGDLTIAIEFIVSDAEADRIVEAVRAARMHVFYARSPVEFDVIEPEAGT
jgi:PII-like signaling protein